MKTIISALVLTAYTIACFAFDVNMASEMELVEIVTAIPLAITIEAVLGVILKKVCNYAGRKANKLLKKTFKRTWSKIKTARKKAIRETEDGLNAGKAEI